MCCFNSPQCDEHPAAVSQFDMDKVKSTLKQFVRDWSEEGAAERQACYQPVINQILEYFPRHHW